MYSFIHLFCLNCLSILFILFFYLFIYDLYICILYPCRISKKHINILIPRAKTHTRFVIGCSIPSRQCFLKKQYPYKIWSIPTNSKSAVFLSQEVHFSCQNILCLPSIVQHFVSLHTQLLHNMQCEINIQYCCPKVPWPMHITTFS